MLADAGRGCGATCVEMGVFAAAMRRVTELSDVRVESCSLILRSDTATQRWIRSDGGARLRIRQSSTKVQP